MLCKFSTNFLFNGSTHLNNVFDIDISKHKSITDFFQNFIDQRLINILASIELFESVLDLFSKVGENHVDILV